MQRFGTWITVLRLRIWWEASAGQNRCLRVPFEKRTTGVVSSSLGFLRCPCYSLPRYYSTCSSLLFSSSKIWAPVVTRYMCVRSNMYGIARRYDEHERPPPPVTTFLSRLGAQPFAAHATSSLLTSAQSKQPVLFLTINPLQRPNSHPSASKSAATDFRLLIVGHCQQSIRLKPT